jgi:hypothetical protein
MGFSKNTALSALAVLGMCVAMAPKAEAAFVAVMEQVGGDVVVTGSGTINLSALTLLGNGNIPALIVTAGAPDPAAAIFIGTPDSDPTDTYSGFTGPTSFGSGESLASSGSGDKVGLQQYAGDYLGVPEGYVSGSVLSDTSTYDDATLASLGVTPGTYIWTWGDGSDADSFTLDINAPATSAPEPASIALLATGLAALGFGRRRRKAA